VGVALGPHGLRDGDRPAQVVAAQAQLEQDQ
jgi:hypothetical protein